MNLKGTFKKETFVYFLLKNKKIVYVGQTINGINRIKEHLTSSSKDFDDFKIIKCDESELDEIENKFIIKFNPIYNQNLNSFNVKAQYIVRKLYEKIGFNPYSKKMIEEIIKLSPFKKELYKEEQTILKKDADIIINFLIEEYNQIKLNSSKIIKGEK